MINPRALIDAPDPYTELEALGLQVQRTTRLVLDSTYGKRNGNTVHVHTWKLPRSLGVRATFSLEQLHHKLIKLFKQELQVGDPLFDDRIYISTDTPDETAHLLHSEQLQGAILYFVASRGGVTIQEDTITIQGPLNAEDYADGMDLREELTLLAYTLYRFGF